MLPPERRVELARQFEAMGMPLSEGSKEVLGVASGEAGEHAVGLAHIFIGLASVYPTRLVLEKRGITPEGIRDFIARHRRAQMTPRRNGTTAHIDFSARIVEMIARKHAQMEGRDMIEPRDMLAVTLGNWGMARKYFEEVGLGKVEDRNTILEELDSIIVVEPEQEE